MVQGKNELTIKSKGEIIIWKKPEIRVQCRCHMSLYGVTWVNIIEYSIWGLAYWLLFFYLTICSCLTKVFHLFWQDNFLTENIFQGGGSDILYITFCLANPAIGACCYYLHWLLIIYNEASCSFMLHSFSHSVFNISQAYSCMSFFP